ncbi:hypothetical protein SALBM135S_02223 [Streptomyces alboniger]
MRRRAPERDITTAELRTMGALLSRQVWGWPAGLGGACTWPRKVSENSHRTRPSGSRTEWVPSPPVQSSVRAASSP